MVNSVTSEDEEFLASGRLKTGLYMWQADGYETWWCVAYRGGEYEPTPTDCYWIVPDTWEVEV